MHDQTSSLIQTTDGGYALVGFTESYGAGSEDFWLVKTDASGQAEWNETFGGTMNDGTRRGSLIQTTDGGYAFVGGTSSYGAGASDMWLIKTDASGQMEWNETFGGIMDESSDSLIQTTDGGFALAGGTDSYGAGESDFWLVKTDANGQAEWNKTYGGAGGESVNSLIQTTEGGYALAGGTDFYGDFDFWLVKTDVNGQAEWNETFGGIDVEDCKSIIQSTDGGLVLAGYTFSYGAGEADMWVIKIKQSETKATTTQSWTSIIVLTSITALLITRKRKKPR